MGIFSYTFENTFVGKFRIGLNKTNKLLKMLKRIWMPFLALAIVSCSSEMSETNDAQNTNGKEPGFVLKYSDPTKMTARDFALAHCLLVKELTLIGQDEDTAGHELEDDLVAELELAKNDEEVKSIIESNGMSTENAARVVQILNQDLENFRNFVADNPDFLTFDSEIQQGIIKAEINGLISENPGDIFPVFNNPDDDYLEVLGVKDCVNAKNTALNDCFEDVCVTLGLGVLGAFLGGGGAAIVGGAVGGWAQGALCEKRAWRSYHGCMNALGIPSIFH